MSIWKFPSYNISCIEIQEIIRKQEWKTRLLIYYKAKRITDKHFELYAVKIRDTEGE
jgi:hypothetical protein